MQISGRAHEGWMTVIPLSVFVFVVIVALGGPSAFVNVVSLWVVDVIAYAAHWMKSL
jgi:hypothetical protein